MLCEGLRELMEYFIFFILVICLSRLFYGTYITFCFGRLSIPFRFPLLEGALLLVRSAQSVLFFRTLRSIYKFLA